MLATAYSDVLHDKIVKPQHQIKLSLKLNLNSAGFSQKNLKI